MSMEILTSSQRLTKTSSVQDFYWLHISRSQTCKECTLHNCVYSCCGHLASDEEAEQWRLNVLDFNSYFKVVETNRVGNQLQILPMQIPLLSIPMFAGMGNINIGEDMDLIKITRKSFDDKSTMESLPRLESEAWNNRTDMLPGTCSNGCVPLDPQMPNNERVANLHNAILGLSQDDTDLNKPFREKYSNLSKTSCLRLI